MPATSTTYDTLVAELSRVIDDQGMGRALAKKAGFPNQLMPNANTPIGFWRTIITEARNGAGEGGVLAIAREARGLYASNSIFQTCLGDLRSGTEWWELVITFDKPVSPSEQQLVASLRTLSNEPDLKLSHSFEEGTCLVFELTRAMAGTLSICHTKGELEARLDVRCDGFRLCHRQPSQRAKQSSEAQTSPATIDSRRRPVPRGEQALATIDERGERSMQTLRPVAGVIQFSLGPPLVVVLALLAWLAGLVGAVPETAMFIVLLGTMAGFFFFVLASKWWTTPEHERCKAIHARYRHALRIIEQHERYLRDHAEATDDEIIRRREYLVDRVVEELLTPEAKALPTPPADPTDPQ